jgi:chemotaxis protein CheD
MCLQAVRTPQEAEAAIRDILANLVGTEHYACFLFDSRAATPEVAFSLGAGAKQLAALRTQVGGLANLPADAGGQWLGCCSLRAKPEIAAVLPLRLRQSVVGAIVIFRLLPQKDALATQDYALFEILSRQAAVSLHGNAEETPGKASLAGAPRKAAIDPYPLPACEEPADPLRREFLHPGQICIASEPCLVTTIVGSCVALCLWDPVRRVGGAAHYLLAAGNGDGPASCRYGDVAIRTLLQKMAELGCQPSLLQAHVLGGACMFKAWRGHNLGATNVEIARLLLAENGIPIVTEQVGGERGRKVVFSTSSGALETREI